jgi:hypothetical protein
VAAFPRVTALKTVVLPDRANPMMPSSAKAAPSAGECAGRLNRCPRQITVGLM